LAFTQTIKLEGYSSPYMEFCPEGVTELEFSARDVWNNKLHGDFTFEFFVNGVSDNSIRIFVGNNNPPGINPLQTPTVAIGTDSNKEVIIRVVHYNPISEEWEDGFAFQSNNIKLRVRFKQSIPFSTWKQDDFFIKSNVIEPGLATNQGFGYLFFCEPGDIIQSHSLVFLKTLISRNFVIGIINGFGSCHLVGK